MSDTSPWFYRLRDDFPIWKKLIWFVLGKKLQGVDTVVGDDGYPYLVQVTGYEFRGITMVWKIETDSEYWRYP